MGYAKLWIDFINIQYANTVTHCPVSKLGFNISTNNNIVCVSFSALPNKILCKILTIKLTGKVAEAKILNRFFAGEQKQRYYRMHLMGGNKTDKAIDKVSTAAGGGCARLLTFLKTRHQ